MLGAFSLASWAQEAVTVKGTVIDSEDNPVVGATVVIKGTTEGTITDIDGNYSISVLPGQVLEFSYVGMQPSQVTVGNQRTINVKMADGEMLDEVFSGDDSPMATEAEVSEMLEDVFGGETNGV